MNEKRNFIPKNDIAYWFPVSTKMSKLVETMSKELMQDKGLYIPPYQLIEKCINDCKTNMDNERESQGTRKPYHG